MKAFDSLRTTVIVGALAFCAVPAMADTLILKTGERITGYFEGGTARVLKFRAAGGDVKDYDILSVQQLQFSDEQKTTVLPTGTTGAAAAPRANTNGPAGAATTAATTPQLRPGTDRQTGPPAAANAASTSYTFPSGSKIKIRMIDSISSEKQSIGAPFIATLDEPILSNGVEVVPKGADIRGRISNISDAGRLTGSAQLGLELTQIIVNGISYSITTSEYSEVGESRTGQTVTRTGVGAGVGAIIGAIAGGGKGAAIGAGVGGGGAAAVQVMTKGEKLNIPSETKLEFALRTPLVIAGR